MANPFEGVPKPLPVATETSAPFWAGLRDGEVRIQRCTDCGRWIFYPRSNCPGCLSNALAWETVSGRGVVHTFTVAHQPTNPLFSDETPQKLVIVELEEGVHMASTLVDVQPEAIEIGMAVEPVFEATDGGEGTLLRFRPARSGDDR
ncbi:MAG: Zn-ribbon domain-containing OB-fold protein [bacterium]|nr:Zn-ribbon domain-containing OB-fold protein [bacterium]